MTLSTATATSRRLVSILSALVLAAAFPETSMAMTAPYTGLWKINIAKSKFGPGMNTVVIERVKATDGSASTFLVINKGKAYIAAAAASASNGVTAVDYNAWRGMNLVQIGTNVKAVDECGFRCQFGLTSGQITVKFRAVNAGRPLASMLALQSK